MHEILCRTFLVLSSFILTLVFSELAFRITNQAPVVYRLNPKGQDSAFELSENEILGYEFKKNFRSSSPSNHKSFAYTNGHGLRDIERTLLKPGDVKRVILLGDSVVAGAGIADLNHTISRTLDVALESQKVEVLNFGVNGYCTLGEVELLRTKGLKFKPDAVVIVFVENDFIESNGTLIRHLSFTRPKFSETLFLQSDLFRWLSLRFNLFHFQDEFDTKDKYLTNVNAMGKNNVQRGLETIKGLSEQYKFKTLIAIWPSFSDAKIFYHDNQFIKNDPTALRIERIAQGLDIPTIRLLPYFQEDLERKIIEHNRQNNPPSPQWSYTVGDGVHPSKNGTSIAAKALKKQIEGLLFLGVEKHEDDPY